MTSLRRTKAKYWVELHDADEGWSAVGGSEGSKFYAKGWFDALSSFNLHPSLRLVEEETRSGIVRILDTAYAKREAKKKPKVE